MFSVDVPREADGQELVPEAVWVTWPPDVQAVVVALVQQVVALAAEVRALKARLGQNSTNLSRPPSSDSPFVPRRHRVAGMPAGSQATP